jgi:hypothetical protein
MMAMTTSSSIKVKACGRRKFARGRPPGGAATEQGPFMDYLFHIM